jgi:catechol 2,3-dioxygenase-like lactoylglutathione lyase family enzyme
VKSDIFAITIFTSDLAETRRFYAEVFEVAPVHHDEVSVVFKFGGVLLNILDLADGEQLIAPAKAAASSTHHGTMITLHVEDADAECERLKALGVTINNGPVNQPWGIRAFTFADPAGQLWEFSQPLS